MGSSRKFLAFLLFLILAGVAAPITYGQNVKGPAANAGPDQTIPAIGTTVHLTGTASTGAVNFQSTFLSQPARSTALLNGSTSPTPTFVPDRPGRYRVQLTVDD